MSTSPDLSIRKGNRRLALFVRVLPLLVFLIAAAVYGRTLARTLTWRHDSADGGDLIAAAATLGVPHPSGYPTYVLLARLFLQALPRGEPAFRVHWLSALSGAAAAALLALSSVETQPAPAGRPSPSGGQRTWQSAASFCAVSAALLFAFSPLAWGQATIAEVHALNVLFVAALFWLLLRWRARGSVWLALAAAFLYGLSLGNHLTVLLLLPAVLLWLLACGRRGASQFGDELVEPHPLPLPPPPLPPGEGEGSAGRSPTQEGGKVERYAGRETRPGTEVHAPRRMRLTRRAWGAIIGAFLLGLAVYAYLPLSAARQPSVNWGDPQTWDRFWWLVSGRLYREAIFGLPPAFIPGRLSAWGHLLLEQFGWWGWALALVGLWRLSWSDRAALGFSLYAFAAYSLYAVTYDRADSYVYLLPACWMVAFWLGQGLTALDCGLRNADCGMRLPIRVLRSLILLLVALLPLLPLLSNFAAQDLRREREAADFATAALAAAEPGALIVSGGDRDTFALWYRRYALGERPDVTVVNASLWGFDWYRRTLAAHHPAVALPDGATTPPDLPGLIEANLRQRPVYVTGDAQAAISGCRMEPVGPLYRLQPHEGDGV
ncbi:MAG: DUF2723 domain-containing protein [Anaerolineae bacterium]|nr:DUF2723 domain-containing protein [Anaerolineae bacterium]